MKTKLMYLVAVLLLLASCGGGYNPPDNPGNGGNNSNNGTTTPQVSPKASFTHKLEHPLYIVFNNTSLNATSYTWDFGDGNTSRDTSPRYRYATKGVYNVTLTAAYNGKTDKYTKQVTVVEPTTCYVTGITYEMIPKNNEYYNIRFTDDYLLFETLYWSTSWVMLSSANIPYHYTMKTKQKIDFGKNEYMLRLYQNTKASGTGTQVAKWKVDPSDIKLKFKESITGSNSNAKVTLNFEWKD